MINLDRSWIVIDPTMVLDQCYLPPNPNEGWVVNSIINTCRLLQAPKYHILNPQLRDTKADVYFLISFISDNLDAEIEFVKLAHQKGSKVVLALLADSRYTTGMGLFCNNTFTVYTKLCDEVDLIASGVDKELHIFGKNQYKVVEMSEFVEKLNFPIIPYENKTIDIFSTGFNDESSLPFAIVLFEMLKDKYPEKRFVYSFRNLPHTFSHIPQYNDLCTILNKKYPYIEFTMDSFSSLISQSKFYINLEARPRGGRALLESWQHRVPFMSYYLTYYSKLFPDFTFRHINYDSLVNIYNRMLNSNYIEIIKKSEEIMEFDYAQNVYNRLTKRLDTI